MTLAMQTALFHLYKSNMKEGKVIKGGSVLVEGVILPYANSTWKKLLQTPYLNKYVDYNRHKRIRITLDGIDYINCLSFKTSSLIECRISDHQLA